MVFVYACERGRKGLGALFFEADGAFFRVEAPIPRNLTSCCVIRKARKPRSGAHALADQAFIPRSLRLFNPTGKGRMAVYGGTAFVVAVGITFICLSIFICSLISRGWDKSVPGICINDTAILLSNAAFNMAADVIVFIIPVPML
jgi:hypothetical protein